MRGESKVVLVTGASSGIGLQIAQRLARDGHTVFGASRLADFAAPHFHALLLDVAMSRS